MSDNQSNYTRHELENLNNAIDEVNYEVVELKDDVESINLQLKTLQEFCASIVPDLPRAEAEQISQADSASKLAITSSGKSLAVHQEIEVAVPTQ